VGYFNTPLSPTERSSKGKKIIKEISELNDTIDQIELINTYSNSKIYILLLAHGSFSKRYHILSHKASLNKFKKIEKTSVYSLTTME
jgi:hypothetical protein